MKFDEALKLVLKAEAGYVNDPLDAGGETIFGISRKSHPDCPMWKMLDQWKAQGHDAASLTKIAKGNYEFMAFVSAIYRGRYWNPCECDKLPPIIRYPVFNCAVNCGHIQAGKFLQRAVDATVDGIIGRKTINATILAKKQPLLDKFYAQWATFYDLIVQRKPEQKRFLNGWKNRIADVQKDNHE